MASFPLQVVVETGNQESQKKAKYTEAAKNDAGLKSEENFNWPQVPNDTDFQKGSYSRN